MTYWGVRFASGEWLSRGRFDKSWSGVFRLRHPELFDSFEEAYELAVAKLCDTDGEVTLVPFESNFPLPGKVKLSEIERLAEDIRKHGFGC